MNLRRKNSRNTRVRLANVINALDTWNSNSKSTEVPAARAVTSSRSCRLGSAPECWSRGEPNRPFRVQAGHDLQGVLEQKALLLYPAY